MGSTDRHTIIVGAGVVGVMAAYYLARRSARVTLIDAGSVAAGASRGNAGMISLGHLPIQQPGVVARALRMMWSSDNPLYIAPRLDPALWAWLWRFRAACAMPRLEANMKTLNAISAATVGLFEEIHERSRAAFFYEKRGYMEVYITDDGLRRGREHGDLTRRFGFGYELLGRDELLRREPALTDRVRGAILYPDSAFCNPHRFVCSVADLCRAMHVEVIEHAPAARIDAPAGRARAVILKDGRAIEGDTIVLAAGSWTPGLARPLGVRIPMQAAKGYHRDLPMPDPPLTIACVLGEASMAATPMDGFLRLAGTLEFSGLNLRLRRNRLDMLSVGARRYLARFDADAAPLSEWVGMRPCSPDGLPIVGWAPGIEGLFIATGHAMLGLTQGPATGKVVSECILDGRATSLDIAPMRVDRF